MSFASRDYASAGIALLFFGFGLTTQLAATCEEQDFWLMPNMSVQQQDTEKHRDGEIFCHPSRVARHDLDYTLTNTSAERSIVVVEARSFMRTENETEDGGCQNEDDTTTTLRGERRQVHDLAANESIQRRFSELDLKLGDGISVNLSCCDNSACSPSEVTCPENEELAASCNNYPTAICLVGCQDDGSTQSTAVKRSGCAGDQCLASCLDSHLVGCCDHTLSPDSTCRVPCCTDSTCTDFSCELSALNCPADTSLGCQGFLTRCVTGCDDPTVRTCGRQQCIETCLLAFERLADCCALSSSCDAPCCFEDACNAELGGVVKLSPIECLDESSACSSDQFCNDRGLCENNVAQATSSCSSVPTAPPLSSTWLLLGLALCGLCSTRRALIRRQLER